MKNLLIPSLFFAVVLTISSINTPAAAQNINNPQPVIDLPSNQDVPGDNTSGITTTDRDDQGFNLWWLLPLLAIPLLFLFRGDKEEKIEREERFRSYGEDVTYHDIDHDKDSEEVEEKRKST